MTHRDSSSTYVADIGHLFVRKSDGFVMGDRIDLGTDDAIGNYEEREFSAEEIASFWGGVDWLSGYSGSCGLARACR